MRELSFFKAAAAPYYIFAPDYTQKSAGIRSLHYLCHALNELGYEAYITGKITHPPLRTPLLTERVMRQHAEAGRIPVVVYPEVVSGNPMGGRVVARWLLNQAGHLSGDRHFDDGDLIFTYSRAFFSPGDKRRVRVMHIPTVDTTIFNNLDNPDNDKRDLVCYYANKYLAMGGRLTSHAKGAFSLCQDVRLGQREIAAVLRRTRLLYIYEPTALMNEALLCGCPVCVVVTDYWKSNTSNLVFSPDIGVAMEDKAESIAAAKRTVSNYAERYEQNIALAWDQLRRFVNTTQWRANVVGQQLIAAAAGPVSQVSANPPLAASRGTPTAVNLPGHLLAWVSSMTDVRPVFDIVIPLPAGREELLSATLESLTGQHYPHWRLTVLSESDSQGGAELPAVGRWVPASGSYVPGYNQVALESGGDWFITLEAGDRLEPHALVAIVAAVARHPQWQVVCLDEDSMDANSQYQRPFFKPDACVDFHRVTPYALSGGIVVGSALLRELSGFRAEHEGAEYYDLILRAYALDGGDRVGHIADILFHRHAEGGHGALEQDAVIGIRRKALEGHLNRIGTAADVESGALPGTFRIRYRITGDETVSIIVPTHNGGASLQRCVSALIENTDYKNWELIVVDQDSDDPETRTFLDFLRGMNNDAVTVMTQPRGLSVPALLNAGAARARGQYVLFQSDAGAPLRNDWLEEMLGYVVQPGVGVVGPKMVGQDSNISSAGYILGLEGRPAGLHDLHAKPDDLGYFGQLQVPGNPSAVMWTCMLTSKALFDQLGGFDAEALPNAYFDVDYCLKSWKADHRVVWTPYAVVLHEHLTEPPEDEVDEEEDSLTRDPRRPWHLPTPEARVMFDRWLDRIAFDPAYNRNLSLNRGAFKIETEPALTWDPEFRPVPRILAHTADQGACGEYRVIAPMRALIEQGRIQGCNTGYYFSIPELARIAPDTIIFQRQVYPKQIELAEDYVRHNKAFRVYELDDLLTNVQVSNQAKKAYTAKDLVKRFRHMLDLCDRFVVSTNYMAEEYRKFKDDIVVVPNTIERAKWGHFKPQRRVGRKPRVGWAGGHAHTADLAIIADVVKALADEVEWVFFCLCPEGVRHLVEYHGCVPMANYPQKLASLNLDLALAPLEDVPFNHAKSNLRLLEYGALGYPVICTDITPYRGDFQVTRVKNRHKDWVEAIRSHVADMDELARRGDALRKHVQSGWMLEDNLDRWLKAWLP